MARVLIVDDSSFMRKRVAQILESAGHTIVGQACDGIEGFDAYKRLSPDFVVMDVTMRGMDGISSARLIRSQDPKARVIMMSMISDPDVIEAAKDIGIVGFVSKDSLDCITAIIQDMELQGVTA